MWCKYCQGAGCLYCPPQEKPAPVQVFRGENINAMPGLIATFKRDDPADMELARQAIGGEALKKAFSPGGGGAEEIIENCQLATLIQSLRPKLTPESL